MYSPQVFLSGAILLGILELVVWQGVYPSSFVQTFDPVEREQIEIVPSEIDLGDLAIGELRAVRVRVTNRNDRAVTLRQPKSTCGCIRFTLDHPVELEPGETTRLAMNFQAPSHPGPVQKNILVQVETAELAWRIPLTGQVVAESWASPPALDVVIDEKKGGVVHFSSGEEVADVIVSHPDKIEVTLGIPSPNALTYKVRVNAETEGEGYVAFLSAKADCLATVPVHWGPPSLVECSPSLIILDPGETSGENKREIVVLRASATTTDLSFEPQVDWIRIEKEKTMSDRVINISIVADRRLSPHSFRGEIIRVKDKKSGQTVAVKGRI